MAPHVSKSRLNSIELKELYRLYDIIESEIKALEASNRREILLRILVNRRALCTFLGIEKPKYYVAYRDSLMADNIFWLVDRFCGDDKVFLWAANLHLAAVNSGSDENFFMGEYLYQRFDGAYYNIDLVRKRFGSELKWKRFSGERKRKSALISVRKTKSAVYKSKC